jgi:hypothetical protein
LIGFLSARSAGSILRAAKVLSIALIADTKLKLKKNRMYAKQYYHENPEKYAKSRAKNRGNRDDQKTSLSLYDPSRWACINHLECVDE